MKKRLFDVYGRTNHSVPYIGTMTEESRLRKQAWLKNGCNAFDAKRKTSQPLSFWTEQDIFEYLNRYNLKIADVYGEIIQNETGEFETTGVSRTGCIFCAFGCHLEKGESRFEKLAKTHPKQYEYCISGGEWIDNPDYDPTLSKEPDEFGWVEWNPKKIFVPNKEGLGFGTVFDICNNIYGKKLWRY